MLKSIYLYYILNYRLDLDLQIKVYKYGKKGK